jgi:hypothetical protein
MCRLASGPCTLCLCVVNCSRGVGATRAKVQLHSCAQAAERYNRLQTRNLYIFAVSMCNRLWPIVDVIRVYNPSPNKRGLHCLSVSLTDRMDAA